MELDATAFNLPDVTAVVPTTTAIATALSADPNINTMAGPYTARDPKTKGVKTRKICPVHNSLTGL